MSLNSDLGELLLKHAALVLLICIGSLLVRRSSAAIQHRYLLLGFVWVALLPLLAFGLPEAPIVRSVPDPSYRAPIVKLICPWIEPAGNVHANSEPQATSSTAAAAIAAAPPGPVAPAPIPSHLPIVQFVICLYTVGVLVGLARLGASLFALRRLSKRGVPASPETIEALASAAHAMGIRRVPRLLVNPAVSVPLTFWMGRQTVVLPTDEASQAVLVHECAHIRRGDWLAQSFCRLVSAVNWFDPILPWMERRMRSLSEVAADDQVVASGIAAPAYAEELFSIARHASGRGFAGSVAIVGSGDLKARVRQLLRSGPRSTRVRFRWMAGLGLAGAVFAVACAAVHYSTQQVRMVKNGLITLPDGSWFQLVAITDASGDKPISWNLNGEVLPRALGPQNWISHPERLDPAARPNTRKFLVFATNMDDTDGFEVIRKLDAGVQGWSYAPPSITGETLICAPVDLPSSGSADVTVTAPSQADWRVVTTAKYHNRRQIWANGPGIFPAMVDPGFAYTVEFPKGLRGLVEMQMFYANSDHPQSMSVDTATQKRGSLFLSQNIMEGPITKLVLRVRPEPDRYLLTGVPAAPNPDRILRATPPDGIHYETARYGRYYFRGGEEVSLVSVSEPNRGRSLVWDSNAAPLPVDPVTDRAFAGSQKGNFPEFDSFDEFTAPRSGETLRILQFEINPPMGADVTLPDLALYDAFGMTASSGWTVEKDLYGSESVMFFMPAAKDASPRDLVVRMADPYRGMVRRIGLDEAFTTHKFMPVSGGWSGSQRKEKMVVSRAGHLQSLCDDPRRETEIQLVDAKGGRIRTLTPEEATDIAERYTVHPPLDRQFVFAASDKARVSGVEVISRPYIYIRFPNVHVNPMTTQEAAK